MTIIFWRFFKIFFDFLCFFLIYLHPRRWHSRKGAAAEAMLLCEEVLEVAPKGLGGGTLAEDCDGGHSCVGL